MIWRKLLINEPTRLEFPNKTIATCSYLPSNDMTHCGMCEIDFIDAKNKIKIIEVADDGQTVDTPCIWEVLGKYPDKIFLFGGTVSYILNTAGDIESRINLYRERVDEEYWQTEIVETSYGLLFIYEGGIFLLDDSFNQKWHRKKYYNETYKMIDHEILILINDDIEVLINVVEGSLISPVG